MERADRIKCAAAAAGMDGVILTSPHNRFYASGFDGTDGIVLISDKAYLIVDSRYTIQAAEQAKGFEIITAKGALINEVGRFDLHNAGYESDSISVSQFTDLKKVLPDCSFQSCTHVMQKLRMIKDETEIEKIRKSMKLADKAFAHILKYIKRGITEQDIAVELEFFMRRQGAKRLSFDTITASGVRGAMPHGEPTDKIIENGEFVTMDFGCELDGYCSDITRTVMVGEPTDRQIQIYNTVLSAQEAALREIKAGVPAKQPDAAARAVMAEAGLDKYFTHSLGHGVGVQVHEKPTSSPKSEDVLAQNMIMTVEPGIYIEGFCGVRIEDMVAVTADGCENLTHSPKELIIV